MRIMKKTILGLMLIVGSVSFANDRLDRGEQKFLEWQNKNLVKQERSLDENLNRGVQKSVHEDLSKTMLTENERGSERN
jgi:hypothetical protein